MKRTYLYFIFLILFLLLLLIYTYQDANEKFDILIKNHQKQLTKIEQLQKENERLENVIVYQYQQMRDLQSKSVVEPIIHKEEQKQIHKQEDITDIINHPTTIVATLLSFGEMLKSLVPSFGKN